MTNISFIKGDLMRNFFILLFSVLSLTIAPIMAESDYDFEEILGIKMGESINSIKNLDQYEESGYEHLVLDERGCSFGESFRQYWINEIVEDSPERKLVNLATINGIIAYLDIFLIKKSDDKFNDFIDQNFSFLVAKWGEPIYEELWGYNFKPDSEVIESILYNQYGDRNAEYRGISINYKSKIYLKAKDDFLGCSFSFE